MSCRAAGCQVFCTRPPKQIDLPREEEEKNLSFFIFFSPSLPFTTCVWSIFVWKFLYKEEAILVFFQNFSLNRKLSLGLFYLYGV